MIRILRTSAKRQLALKQYSVATDTLSDEKP